MAENLKDLQAQRDAMLAAAEAAQKFGAGVKKGADRAREVQKIMEKVEEIENKITIFKEKQLPLMNKAKELANSFKKQQSDLSNEYTKQSSLSNILNTRAAKFAGENKKTANIVKMRTQLGQIDNDLSKAALNTLEQIQSGNLDLNDLSSLQLDKAAAKNKKEKLLIKSINDAVESQKAFLDGTNAIDKAIKKLEQGFNKVKAALTMTAIFGALLAVAKKFGATIDAIGQKFGNLSVMGEPFKNDLLDASVEATKLGGGIEDVAAITSTLASNFGMNVDEAAKLSGKVFDTSKAIGLSADEGANLFGVLTQTANLSADQAEKLAEGAFQLARQAGVAPSAVMQDIAGSAEEIAEFTKDGGDNIAEAAVQARQMGLSLGTTAKISKGLLDFESSISNEIEASVMIGKQLNFQKARQLALDGDIAGATKNIVDQLGSEAEFNKLNVLQRESLAKSIGVSVGELSKMVSASDKLTLSGAMAGKSFGDLLGQDAISNISNIVNEFKALGATLIQELGPTIETLLGQFRTWYEEGNGLETIKGIIHGISGAIQLVANNLPTLIGLMVAFKAASLGAAIASTIAGISAVGAATLGLGIPIFLGVIAAAIASAKMSVPKAQTGISGFSGGNLMVGESGPEILNVPRGSSVTGAEQTRQKLIGAEQTRQLLKDVLHGSNVIGAEQTRQMTQGQNFGKIESALERLVSINLVGNEQRGNQRIIGRRGELAIASEPQRGGLPLGIV